MKTNNLYNVMYLCPINNNLCFKLKIAGWKQKGAIEKRSILHFYIYPLKYKVTIEWNCQEQYTTYTMHFDFTLCVCMYVVILV